MSQSFNFFRSRDRSVSRPESRRYVFDFLGGLGLRGRSSMRSDRSSSTSPRRWFSRLLASDPKSSQNTSTGTRVQVEIQKQDASKYRREVEHWQWARNLRYRSSEPLSYALQEVYTDAMVDAHLSAVVTNRVLRLQNKRYVLRNAQGELQKARSQWLQRSWFQELIGHVVSSIFYGYSLIWIKSARAETHQLELELIDRRHVVPERRRILKGMQDKKGGLSYTKWPYDLLYAQLGDSVGLLEKIVPLTILKRHSWANWDEFEQIFGMPIRIAKVPSLETRDTQRIAEWLEEMGTAAYAVLPESAQVEVKESRRTDAHEVFKEKILCINAEISKLINGQTMTVDSGSSRSQSEVHMRTEHEITRADIRNLLCWLNDVLLPALRSHGFDFKEDDRVDIYEEGSMADRMQIDKELLRFGVPLSRAYLSRTYGVEIAGPKAST